MVCRATRTLKKPSKAAVGRKRCGNCSRELSFYGVVACVHNVLFVLGIRCVAAGNPLSAVETIFTTHAIEYQARGVPHRPTVSCAGSKG